MSITILIDDRRLHLCKILDVRNLLFQYPAEQLDVKWLSFSDMWSARAFIRGNFCSEFDVGRLRGVLVRDIYALDRLTNDQVVDIVANGLASGTWLAGYEMRLATHLHVSGIVTKVAPGTDLPVPRPPSRRLGQSNRIVEVAPLATPPPEFQDEWEHVALANTLVFTARKANPLYCICNKNPQNYPGANGG